MSAPVPHPTRPTTALRRFAGVEIALHWSVVVPYLALALSGAALLATKNGAERFLDRGMFLTIHLVAGVALVVLPLIVLIVSPPGPFAATAREALRWSWRDIWWLHASALRIVFPRIRLPREGRFNAGQKLNLLHVMALVPALIATGTFLWFGDGSALLVRVLHVSGALLSMAMAGGHMYLALIHPPTRRALGAMFHGRVSSEYAAHHHSAWHEELTGVRPREPAPTKKPIVATAPVVITVLVIGGAIALAASKFGREAWARLQPAFAEPRAPLSPGPLHSLHAKEAYLASCGSCHASGLEGTRRELCLDCHDDVATRLERREGYHGKLDGECSTCHADHRTSIVDLDDAAFQHDQATFALSGAHRGLECAACHDPEETGQRNWFPLPHEACTSCHDDPHSPSLDTDCTRCHSEEAWSHLHAFDHDRDTEFALVGAHRVADCAACHRNDETGLVLRGTARECASCHDDPHEPSLEDTCDRCHTPETWHEIVPSFRHDVDTSFALTGAHRTTSCRACHPKREGRAPLLASTPNRCDACHDDPHAAVAIAPTPARVSLFPLEPSPTDDRDCAACHEASTDWRAARFDHERDARFARDDRHRVLACSSCHDGTNALFFRFQSEDETDAADDFECSTCHGDVADALAGRLLDRDPITPSPHFGEVDCEQCHLTEPDARTERCSKCHPPDYDGLFGDWQSRVAVELGRRPPNEDATWKRLGLHHWEGVVGILRSR